MDVGGVIELRDGLITRNQVFPSPDEASVAAEHAELWTIPVPRRGGVAEASRLEIAYEGGRALPSAVTIKSVCSVASGNSF
ncbi:MAG: hypothetical protein NVSMB51_11740 [Solirubrobacteraceae bacterium]